MPSETHATALLDVLRASRPHVGCTALALLAPGPRVSLCWADTPEDRSFADEQLRTFGEQMFREAAGRSEPFMHNKVRLTADGPLLCRVLAVPFHDVTGALAGLLVGLSRPEWEPLDDRSLRRAKRVALVVAPTFIGETDALTGLPGYAAFEREARAALADAGTERPVCVLYADIDQLHTVNDRLGFGPGDRAIAHVGASIRDSLAGLRAMAARLSGDRFTVLLFGCTLAQARAVADRIRERVALPPDAAGTPPVPVTLSLGAAVLRGERPDLQHALAAAELACKAAKDRGRNRVEVYQEADQSMVRRREDVFMLGSLREALNDGRLCVYAQPIVPLAGEAPAPVAYELLARMEDTDGRIVEPAAFMSAATRYQLLPLIDRAVVLEAFAAIDANRPWMHAAGLRFSINLSGPTVSDAGFLEWLLEQMTGNAIDGEWLTFEVTETAAAADLARPQDLIRRLKTRGCRFALDDFGTGVNSLAYLKALDVDAIKLDGSYVRDMLDNPRSEALVKAVTALAGSMGVATVAEYVETITLRDRLRELGVTFGQGFALGRPRPFESLFAEAPAERPAA